MAGRYVVQMKEPEYDMLPAGVYTARCERIEDFRSTNFKTGLPEPAVKIIWKVLEGDW